MTAAAPQAALEAQCQLLAGRAPELAARVRDADDGGIDVVVGPRGRSSLRIGKRSIASAYGPRRDAERIVRAALDGEAADLAIVIGFGLGDEVEVLRDEGAGRIVVHEPSPARLRAALALRPEIDWLDDDALFFCDEIERLRLIVDELYTPGLRVRVLVHPSMHWLDADAVAEAVDCVARMKDSVEIRVRTRTQMLETWTNTTAQNAAVYLGDPRFSILRDTFPGRTAVICAAGPSLTRQLPTLRAHREHLLVVAIGQSLKSLRNAGIEPDFVHVVEHGPVAHQIAEAGDNSELVLVLPPQAHPELFQLPVGRRLCVFPTANPLGVWLGAALGEQLFSGTGGTVAQCAVHLASELGASPILLIGQDLAFTDGRVYADDSLYRSVGFRIVDGDRYEFTGMRDKMALFGEPNSTQVFGGDLIQVEGWDGRPVATNVTYATFRDHYRDIAAQLGPQGIRVVNCTEGGARIPGVEHATFAECCEAADPSPLDFRARLEEAIQRTPPNLGGLPDALRAARGRLTHLQREARKGRRSVSAARRNLPKANGDAELLATLRKIARAERRVRDRIESLSFLEAFVQPELHRFGAETRRADALDPSVEQALDEAHLLLDACGRASERARAVIERVVEATRTIERRAQNDRS